MYIHAYSEPLALGCRRQGTPPHLGNGHGGTLICLAAAAAADAAGACGYTSSSKRGGSLESCCWANLSASCMARLSASCCFARRSASSEACLHDSA